MVNCPEGPRQLDLDMMRRAITRLVIAGRLGDQTMEDLGQRAGMSRSTVSRIFSGRVTSLRKLRAMLVVLGLTFDDVVREPAPTSDDRANDS